MAPLQILPRKVWAVVLPTAAVLCTMAVESMGPQKVPRWNAAGASAPRAIQGAALAAIPPVAVAPNQILPIAPAEAEQINDERPLADRPLQAAAPTYYPTAWDKLARENAKRCLATAVYYEAAGEGWRGELGVAQVVLNRVRHPAYPKTICGVVYQGSQLPTGCQFTFTCDGRLRYPPSPAGWKQAEAVAEAALSGTVEPRVGMSTHYHTRSVVPYWAGSLDKLAVLGNHIFYTFAGAAGNRRAFNAPIMADLVPPGANPAQAAAPVLAFAPVGALTAPVAPTPISPLKADAQSGAKLAADERGTLAPSSGTLLQPGTTPSRLRSDQGALLR